MASFTIPDLSGSTDGRPVPVAATATAGTTIHTATTGSNQIWMWAGNITSTVETLSIEWGGTGTANTMEFLISPDDTILVVPGWYLPNTLIVKAFTTTASQVNIVGYEINLV